MPRRDGLWRFLILVGVTYGLLIVPWPGVRDIYGSMYMEVANATLGSRGGALEIRFRRPKQGTTAQGQDIELAARETATYRVRRVPINTRLDGYLPTALLLSLTLATPIGWTRRGWAIILGMGCMHLLIAARLGIAILKALVTSPPYFQDLSAFWIRATHAAYGLAMQSPASSFLIPIVIWGLVTLRRDDWARFMRSPHRHQPGGS